MTPLTRYPLISIITVCFNSARTIEKTFQGIASQTYQNIEYILIDGGSTDGTLEIVNRNRHLITSYISEPDDGIYSAMNKGINMCHGEIVGIINSDDFYAPDALEQVALTFLMDGDADIILGNCATIGIYNQVIRTDKPHIDFDHRIVSVLHPSAFVSKRCYETHGYFDSSFRYSGDYEFFCRVTSRGVSVCYIDTTLAYFRLGGFGTRVGFIKEWETLLIVVQYWGPVVACLSFSKLIYHFARRRLGTLFRSLGIVRKI